MPNPLQQLHDCGQSFWYDNIRRAMLASGELARMVREDGLRGLTSNPTIFAKALETGAEYDAAIRAGVELPELFLELMIADIQGACDVLRPVYDASGGADGYASIEVFPGLARDGEGTIRQARELWRRVGRPNVMVKIPSTPECLGAIQAALAEGININITLMFGFASYQAVAEAYLTALEQRLTQGQAVNGVASVASLFVSRVDSKLDPRLAAHPELRGQAAIANARRMYRHFQQAFAGPRWQKLAAAGARPQRLLWASTSTKNPAYPDTLYADALVGPHTVDTMPDQTVAAFRDHGRASDQLTPAMANYAAAVEAPLTALAAAGVDLEAAALELQNEGVASFQKSYDELIAGLGRKRARLSQRIEAPAALRASAQKGVEELAQHEAGTRMWQAPSEASGIWSRSGGVRTKIADRLGWLRVPAAMAENAGRLAGFAAECRAAGFTDAVLLGMGGSSLAPEVFSLVFAHQPGVSGLKLHVLDTTDPDSVARIEAAVDLPHTLFILSSKSGGTIEPNSLFAHFWAVMQAQPQPGSHFIAITDPDTSLKALAESHRFRQVFINPPDIGGRYSALSYFGLVPAALLGVDVARLLGRVTEMAAACGTEVPLGDNPGAVLGAAMGTWAAEGRDKLTFVTSPALASLGAWLEQLIAESTGKRGRGVVPVDGEPVGAAGVYGEDRVFVDIRVGEDTADPLAGVAGPAPVIRLRLGDAYDLGREFFRWEYATAMAGVALGINPFDEPNVQESKDNTMRVLQHFLEGGAAAAGFTAPPAATVDGLKIYAPAGAPADLAGWMKQVAAGDYVALMGYLDRVPEMEAALEQLRVVLRDRLKAATTVGFGPRFLHSTGQLHKGGANNGVFLQLTAPPRAAVAIPGQPYDFGTLLAAQAMGDYESLAQHERRLLRVDLGPDPLAGLRQLTAMAQA